jgi:outer membrane protein, multidrug efflux system
LRIKASEAKPQDSLASYEQTVATALEETEGAFDGYTRNAQRAEHLLNADTRAQEAAQLPRLHFDSGVIDFLIVLDAEREVLSNRDQLAQAQTDTATASVYRALCGGWAAMVVQFTALPSNSSRQPVSYASGLRSCRV